MGPWPSEAATAADQLGGVWGAEPPRKGFLVSPTGGRHKINENLPCTVAIWAPAGGGRGTLSQHHLEGRRSHKLGWMIYFISLATLRQCVTCFEGVTLRNRAAVVVACRTWGQTGVDGPMGFTNWAQRGNSSP